MVEHDGFDTLAFRDGLWKFIEPDLRIRRNPKPERSYSPAGELYDLGRDLGETNNINSLNPRMSKKVAGELDAEQRLGMAAGQRFHLE